MEEPIQQRVTVTFDYDVHFTCEVFRPDNSLLAQLIRADGEPGPKKILAVVDAGLIRHHARLLPELSAYAECYPEVLSLQAPLVVPGGEKAKNDPTLPERIHAMLHARGLCRHSYVLAIGGGAVLDLAGFAAANAHRGIRLIRVPTTVLAQNDSGVGVKNGINAFGKKNFLGTFAPPYAVLNDYTWLTTLDDRDWRCGIAEAVKVSLIKDASFFAFITAHTQALAARDMNAMRKLIYRCAKLHLAHIAGGGDPFEMGSSRPLDFGHWAAHKLEQLTNYRLRHGEAVAIGIALDSVYSCLTGLLPRSQMEQVLTVLECIGFTLYAPELEKSAGQPWRIFHGLEEFKQHLGGQLTITLLRSIGEGTDVHWVDEALYRRAVTVLRARCNATSNYATA